MSNRPAPPACKACHGARRAQEQGVRLGRRGGSIRPRSGSKCHPGPLAHPIAPARHQPHRMLVAALSRHSDPAIRTGRRREAAARSTHPGGTALEEDHWCRIRRNRNTLQRLCWESASAGRRSAAARSLRKLRIDRGRGTSQQSKGRRSRGRRGRQGRAERGSRRSWSSRLAAVVRDGFPGSCRQRGLGASEPTAIPRGARGGTTLRQSFPNSSCRSRLFTSASHACSHGRPNRARSFAAGSCRLSTTSARGNG